MNEPVRIDRKSGAAYDDIDGIVVIKKLPPSQISAQYFWRSARLLYMAPSASHGAKTISALSLPAISISFKAIKNGL